LNVLSQHLVCLLEARQRYLSLLLTSMAFASASYSAEPLTCPASNVLIPSSPAHADGILIKNYADHDRQRDNVWMAVGWLYRSDREYGQGAGHAVLAAALVKSRFGFIELESPDGADGQRKSEFVALGGNPSMKYLKLFLSKDGDPACSTYEGWLGAAGAGIEQQQTAEQLRSRPGECLAAKPESIPTARYAYVIEDVPASKPPGGYSYSELPANWRILDLSGPRPVTIAALTRQAKRNAFSCPPLNVRYQFWDSVQPTVATSGK
jgi:hypothetical protein